MAVQLADRGLLVALRIQVAQLLPQRGLLLVLADACNLRSCRLARRKERSLLELARLSAVMTINRRDSGKPPA